MNNPVANETTAISLRKYFYEYVVIVLASAVVALSLMYNNLNTFIRDTLNKQLVDQGKIIERNTDAFNMYITHQQEKTPYDIQHEDLKPLKKQHGKGF